MYVRLRAECYKNNIVFNLLKQLEQSLKGEEVVSKEIMAMTEAEIENEIKEVEYSVFILIKSYSNTLFLSLDRCNWALHRNLSTSDTSHHLL